MAKTAGLYLPYVALVSGSILAVVGVFTHEALKVIGLLLIAASLLIPVTVALKTGKLERRLFLIIPVVSGLIAAIFAYAFSAFGKLAGVSGIWAIAFAPAIEEALKPAVIDLAARMRTDVLNSWHEALAWGGIAGLSFAALELVAYVDVFSSQLPAYEIFLRRLPTFGLHAFETSLVTLGIFFVVAKSKYGWWKLIALYVLAAAMHTAWNVF